MEPTRRDVLKGSAALAAGSALISGAVPATTLVRPMPPRTYLDLTRPPDLVRAWGAEGEIALKEENGAWRGGGVEVRTACGEIGLSAGVPLNRIALRWHGDLSRVTHVLGDTWERSYGDLAWHGKEAIRPLPWYALTHDGERTHGYGVRTGAGAMCFWTADDGGLTLWADVRSGGSPVRLGDRTLAVATVVSREGRAEGGRSGESAYAATHALCRLLCPKPLLAEHPVYGTNDWNFAYGNNSADLIANASGLVSDLSPDRGNRPYSIIDDGWAKGPDGNLGHGPWVGNKEFGDMGAVAARLKGLGVRPGLWFRPLTALPDTPDSRRLARNRDAMDPTLPETLAHVRAHFERFQDWGYEMIKHDFTSWDLFGRWGSTMGTSVTKDGWRFHDDTRTNAEIVLALYREIRGAAGSMKLIGCNTFGHLAAGTHEVQRTGDDTSGRSWERTRKMGVNTLGFRAAQQNAFFTVDPDIVAVTAAIPWELNEQWLRLVAGSGTALFVSLQPDFLNAEHKAALRRALARAAKPQPVGEPLDWMRTDCPREWRLGGERATFDWMGAGGADPYKD